MFKRIGIIVALTLIIHGCSSNSAVITVSDTNAGAWASTSHYLWGLWQFAYDPEAGGLDAAPIRGAAMHLNALKFLEPPPNVYITIEHIVPDVNSITVDIGLRHPFLGQNVYTGFDVAGILISHGTKTGFSDPELIMPGMDDVRVSNPDGYTRWWNPSEFPVNDGTMFTYRDGLLGQPHETANFNATLNGYKLFCDDLNPDDDLTEVSIEGRAKFSAGQKNARSYIIYLGDGLVFNYAVDANWKHPVGSPPWDVPGDFPPDANRPEPWRISVTELENTLYNESGVAGGSLHLSIDVYDHFNAGMNLVRAEAPDEIPMAESALAVGGGYGYSTYEIEINDCNPAQPGPLDLLITIESDKSGYGGLLPGKPVSAYFIHTTHVADEAPPQGKWSDEFVISDWSSCYPVIAQTASGRVIAAWATDPGVGWSEFTSPDKWNPSAMVDPSVVPIRMSISPGRDGDLMYLDTLDYAGNIVINNVPIEYGHTMAYRWQGGASWDIWDPSIFLDHLMSQIFIDFEAKHHFFQGSSHSYGHIQHIQCTNWGMANLDYPFDEYSTTGGNEHEVGYSRCVDDDSNGYLYMVFESDRMKSTVLPPADYRWLRIAKQYLPSMQQGDFDVAVIEEGDMDYLDSPCVAVGSNDRVHVAYRRYVDALERFQIVYRWSDDGLTWSDTNETVVWDDPMQPEWRYISIDTGSDGQIHLTFRAGAKVLYSRSSNGIDWIPFEWVNESIDGIVGVSDHQPWMFVDADDQVHVVWTRLPVIPDPKFGQIRHRWRQP